MIIDAHNHIGKRKGLDFPAEELLRQMDGAGIDCCVVFSHSEAIHNEYVSQATRLYPDRLIPFATVNPWSEEAEKQLNRCLGDWKMQGVKLHPVRHGYMLDDHDLLDPILQICAEYQVPALIYGSADIASSPNNFEELARSFPGVNLIMAHMGYMYETNAAVDIASRNDNIYLEISGVFVRQIQHAIRIAGAHKVLLGTDTPKDDFNFSLEKVYLATEKTSERNLILGENLLRLIKRGTREVGA